MIREDDHRWLVCKGVVIVCLKILSPNFPGETEENKVKPQSDKLVARLRFKPGTFWTQI